MAHKRCLNGDCRLVGGGEWGGGVGAEGAAFLTQNCSLFGLHHIDLSDPLPLWLGNREEVVAEHRQGTWGRRLKARGWKQMKLCGWENRDREWERRKGEEGREEQREVGRCGRAQFIMVPFPRAQEQTAVWNIQRQTRNRNTGSQWRNAAAMLEQRPQNCAPLKALFPGPALILISKVMKQWDKFRISEQVSPRKPKISYVLHLIRLFDAFVMQILHHVLMTISNKESKWICKGMWTLKIGLYRKALTDFTSITPPSQHFPPQSLPCLKGPLPLLLSIPCHSIPPAKPKLVFHLLQPLIKLDLSVSHLCYHSKVTHSIISSVTQSNLLSYTPIPTDSTSNMSQGK